MLRIAIDGNWEPEDFIEVLQGMESLYYKASIKSFHYFPGLYIWRGPERTADFDQFLEQANRWLLAEARLSASLSSRLRVHRIEYGSPGSIDFFGLAGAVKELANAVFRGIEFYDGRHIRAERLEQARLETEIARQNLRSLKLDLSERIIRMRGERDDWTHEYVALAVRDLDKIFPRIAEGKIVGASSEDAER